MTNWKILNIMLACIFPRGVLRGSNGQGVWAAKITCLIFNKIFYRKARYNGQQWRTL